MWSNVFGMYETQRKVQESHKLWKNIPVPTDVFKIQFQRSMVFSRQQSMDNQYLQMRQPTQVSFSITGMCGGPLPRNNKHFRATEVYFIVHKNLVCQSKPSLCYYIWFLAFAMLPGLDLWWLSYHRWPTPSNLNLPRHFLKYIRRAVQKMQRNRKVNVLLQDSRRILTIVSLQF